MNKKSILVAISLALIVLIPAFQNCGQKPLHNLTYEDLLSTIPEDVFVDADQIEDVSDLCGAGKLIVNFFQNEPVCVDVYEFSDFYCPIGLVAINQGPIVSCIDWNEYSSKTVCALGFKLTGVTESKKAVCEPLYDDWKVGSNHFLRGRFMNTVKVQPKYNLIDKLQSEFACPLGSFLQSDKEGYSCNTPWYLIEKLQKFECTTGIIVGIKNWNVPICQEAISLNVNTNGVCGPGTFLIGVHGQIPICSKLDYEEDYSQACPTGQGLKYLQGGKLKCANLNPNLASPQSCPMGSHLIGIAANQPLCASNGPNGFSQYCENGKYISGVSFQRIVCTAFEFHD